MEAKSETVITITDITAITQDNKKNKNHGLPKKNRGAVQLFKVALYMLRRKSGKSKAVQVDVASKGTWKKLVGSMRPLHLQSNQSPLPSIEAEPVALPITELIDEVFTPPMSPSLTNEGSSPATTSVDSMSRYASAVNLQELDSDEEDDGHVDNGGDEMIDVKAEEFIARFYEQMRLQTMDYNLILRR